MNIINVPEYMINHYKLRLREKGDPKGNVYVKCVKGMHGLPYAGISTQKLLM